MEDASEPVQLHIDDGIFRGWVVGIWKPSGIKARIGLGSAIVACWLMMLLATSWFAIPALPGFDGSLLRQPSPVLAILMIAIFLPICTLLGTFLAGAIRFEAGLFAATMGLMTVSLRGGTMQSVLQEAGGQASVYYTLIGELIILAILLGAMWAMLWFIGKKTVIAREEPLELDHDESSGPFACIAQVVSMSLIMMFLCQSEAKYQSLASVGIASCVGTMIAFMSFPTRPGIWYWTGPLAVGLIGYIIAATGNDPTMAIGHPSHGIFSALARPLPLDYASAGPAGSILGYWMMRKK
jgi:hypothetical protein